MDVLSKEDAGKIAAGSYRLALSALRQLPNGCAPSVGELAARIGADKLELLRWVRGDLEFARLIASKVAT